MNTKFSLSSFVLGAGAAFLISAIAAGFGWNYALTELAKGSASDSPLFATTAHQIYQSIIVKAQQKTTTNLVGTLTSNDGSHITVEAQRASDPVQTFTFAVDDSTQFFTTNNEDNSHIAVTRDAIAPGMRVSVVTSETIGSVANQHAMSVTQF